MKKQVERLEYERDELKVKASATSESHQKEVKLRDEVADLKTASKKAEAQLKAANEKNAELQTLIKKAEGLNYEAETKIKGLEAELKKLKQPKQRPSTKGVSPSPDVSSDLQESSTDKISGKNIRQKMKIMIDRSKGPTKRASSSLSKGREELNNNLNESL